MVMHIFRRLSRASWFSSLISGSTIYRHLHKWYRYRCFMCQHVPVPTPFASQRGKHEFLITIQVLAMKCKCLQQHYFTGACTEICLQDIKDAAPNAHSWSMTDTHTYTHTYTCTYTHTHLPSLQLRLVPLH
jgi:hypothetical protein